ncbi:hypothetical protein NBRC3293_1870 [Gluconobacter oxydans NBRC 3293]|uniref:Uncharacterized protein n=1 Tax=Gluconobacter oxydans NBRC 3293 TaxID=1315969 RepID=A0A829WW57_GLUOY|nr:hypothetical protein NBRC3293_1870 [Gluconobacter oxydans NBRC 3293]
MPDDVSMTRKRWFLCRMLRERRAASVKNDLFLWWGFAC